MCCDIYRTYRNLANLPSGSSHGKSIKSCFRARDGWLFCGADYAALEDKVGAEITCDKNKQKEFLEGYDGHSLRAYAFFKEEIDEALGEELDIDDPASINRIKEELPDIRAKSKSPSFAMAYGSGAGKIQQLLKCSKAKAESVFNAYHNLYAGTAVYAERNVTLAKRQGYVTGAFGLKLRTPGINSTDSGKASAEGRSLNNMTIQSYGLLTTRASIWFNERIELDGMTNDVLLINNIHDAIYVECKNNIEVVQWVNKNLIECMTVDYKENQLIKLTAELDIGTSWDKQKTIANDISDAELSSILQELE